MRPLTRYEIVEQLNRLGVRNQVECDVCLCEYMEYFNRYHNTCSQRFKNKLDVVANSDKKNIHLNGPESMKASSRNLGAHRLSELHFFRNHHKTL